MRTLFYDVMMEGRYVCTMRYRYSPIFKIDLKDLFYQTFKQRPSLKKKRFTTEFDNEKIEYIPY